MHNTISELLEKNEGKVITSTIIVDIMNIIGRGVVSGNISIFFFIKDDQQKLLWENQMI